MSVSEDDDDWGMTEEQLDMYNKALHDTDGFDMPYLPNVHSCGVIFPLDIENGEGDVRKIRRYAQLGIDHYNQEQGTSLELLDLVKVMIRGAFPFVYYITFTAKEPSDEQIGTYQTEVVVRCPDVKTYVEFTRVKPDIKSRG